VSYLWTNDVLAGGAGQPYPPITWLPSVTEYETQRNADYSLMPSSPYCGAATDGRDVGIDWTVPMPILRSPRALRIMK